MNNSRESLPQIKEDMDVKSRTLKAAIRWLFEARRFKADFGSNDWKPDNEGELSDIANNVYKEAIYGVIMARKNLQEARDSYRKAGGK